VPGIRRGTVALDTPLRGLQRPRHPCLPRRAPAAPRHARALDPTLDPDLDTERYLQALQVTDRADWRPLVAIWRGGLEYAKRKDKKKPTDPDEPALFKGEGTPATANHGNIPPSVDLLAGGVTISRAEQTVVLSLAGFRRLGFGTPKESEDARTVFAALGFVAVLAAADDGYFLRSRCHLSPIPGKALAFQRVAKDGSDSAFSLTLDDALNLYQDAVAALPERLRWHSWDVASNSWSSNPLGPSMPIATLTAAPKLQQLIRESRRLAEAGKAEEEDATSDA
jgi:hypothetical protein